MNRSDSLLSPLAFLIRFRLWCQSLTEQAWFDFIILVFIACNCITLAMERPNIPPWSLEREILDIMNNVFTIVFSIEMAFKAISTGLFYGENAYFKSGWNIMDGTLVTVSLVDTFVTVVFGTTSKIFDILRVFRLVRALRPLRVINRAPGLKLVVQTLLSSLKPIGNIVLICCTFFIIFGILGVQVRVYIPILRKRRLLELFSGSVSQKESTVKTSMLDLQNSFSSHKAQFC